MGNSAGAARAYEQVLETGKLPAADQTKFVMAIAGLYYQAKDYGKAATWINRYLKEGGTDPKMQQLLIQSYYLSGDYANAGKAALANIQAQEKAGQTPSEEDLQLLANCALKQNDKAGYAQAMEKLVAYHPKKDYWADLLNRVQSKPGFADRLYLDVYRLKLAIGQLKTAEYMEMAQLSLQAGLPAEAVKVIEQGYKSGALGTGPEAERQKRLRDLANKNLAEDKKSMAQNEAEAGKSKDGIALVNLGFELVMMGEADKGLPMIAEGIKKDNLKRPEDAKLHYGVALLMAGKKNEAVQVLKSVQGNDGTADLARYWILQSKSSGQPS
ncbi:hypothetical protein E4K72_03235 [Oxalobacteraceae bacterium OM1]|nr:hypothetical protein E4K72_03235 [Oxalobacteraceae bacterium OM1]